MTNETTNRGADAIPTFVLVGHCVPDSSLLTMLVTRHFSDARIVRANHEAALDAHRRPGCVWLVNRIPDGEFEGDGLHIVAREVPHDGGHSLVLVSNHADAQAAARDRGALPGFGKAALHAPATAEALRGAVRHAFRGVSQRS